MARSNNYDEKFKWWEKTDKQKRKEYVRELASMVSGSREETNRIAAELEADEYFVRMDKEAEERKRSKRMTDDEMNALVDDLFLLKPKS